MRFEWDPRKAEANLRKHGVSFDEASTVFGDPLAATVSDPDHSADEARSITIGQSASQLLVVVVHAHRGEIIRIISARRPTLGEKKKYAHGQATDR
ncbi:MAG TPA: BrnT family toxin [Vicinamibacteria bacterium]|nr:BrnT family toxin [Vicinamibacteria bacterium]